MPKKIRMQKRGTMTKGIDKYSIDSTDYTVGQDNVQKWGFDVHNPVFGISAGFIALFPEQLVINTKKILQ